MIHATTVTFRSWNAMYREKRVLESLLARWCTTLFCKRRDGKSFRPDSRDFCSKWAARGGDSDREDQGNKRAPLFIHTCTSIVAWCECLACATLQRGISYHSDKIRLSAFIIVRNGLNTVHHAMGLTDLFL